MRKTDWKSGLLWVACFALTVFVMGWVTREESDHRLEQDAEQSALRWSRQLAQSVPELGQAFQAGHAAPSTLTQWAALQTEVATFRWKLLDVDGKVVLSSQALEAPATPHSTNTSSVPDIAASGVPPGPLRAQVLSGIAHSALHRGSGPGLPDVYSEVWVPVSQDARVLGLAHLIIDQSAPAASAATGLVRIASVVSLLLMLIGALASYQHFSGRKRQRKAEAQVRYLADHDILTGALNRASFHAVMVQAAALAPRSGRGFSVLRVNLDRFRNINESLGREFGDDVLRLVAQRLRACLQQGDRLGRLEGDEFALLLNGRSSVEAVEPVAHKLSQALAEPFSLAGHEVRCRASTGISLYGVDGTAPDDLLAKTELALFRAKAHGHGTFAFHEAELDQQMQSRRDLARDLHTAVAERQLTVHYQPLFATDAEELVGYGALLRWQHPERGMVSPAEFVPLAESAGLIDEIGLWVLRQACSDASGWPASLTVAVNLSANQFASGTLVRQVSRALADAGLAPERLVLEITESLLMNNSEQVMQTLRHLGALGVSIAMDDFGTGYSSLAYLWRFPFDKVKVDQVFTRNMVKDPKVAMIVRSIITLAHSLDMRVNAEGIENPDQMAALQALGCDELQGFLLGRPAPQALLTHAGHRQGGQPVRPRGDDRESLFATLHMDLPPGLE